MDEGQWIIGIGSKKKSMFINVRNVRFKLLQQSGFSLAEVLAALTIGAMILVAVLGIYGSAARSAEVVTDRLDSFGLAREVLQYIAEDLDRTTAPGSEVRVILESKYNRKGYSTARLEIIRSIRDKKNKMQTFERIIWQTSYDYDSDANGLVLYRSHSGMIMEDKLLDEQKEDWERELFIPICAGVSFFKIQVPRGETFLDRWTSSSLPRAVVVTISFAEPFKTLRGSWDVLDAEKIMQTIAIDRTRKIRFIIEPFISQKKDEEKQDNEQKSLKEPE